MRVLLVNDLAPGPGSGTEVTLQRLVEGLRRAGDDVFLYAGQVAHTGPAKALDLWDPFARRAVAARAREVRAEVVHHHNVLRELSVSVLGVPAGIPSVLTVHDHRLVGDPDGALTGVRRLVDARVKGPVDLRVARRRVVATLAVSDDLAGRLRAEGLPGVRTVAVPAGDPLPTVPLPSATRTVVAAGRLSRDKGLHVLLDAWELLADPTAELVVAGDGPERAALEQRGVGTFVGRLGTDETRELLLSARVVVVPSLPGVRREGTPLVAAEAALLGRCLVTSDDPGLAALVTSLGAGTSVRAGDARALAEALRARLHDDALADAEGAALRAASAPFTTDAVVAQVREVYREVTGG